MALLGSSLPDALRQLVDPKNFQRSFFVLWAIFSVFYFSELANFSLSIDDELAVFRRDPAVWLAQDRWVNYLIERFLLRPPVIPFFPIFVFGALASLSYMIVVKAHRYSLDQAPVLLVFILFGAFPIFYFILDYSVAMVSIGVGVLLSCVAVFLFDRMLHALASPESGRRGIARLFAGQVILGSVAIGIYQSLILLVAAGCCGLFLLRYLRGPAMPVRQILLVHACLACSIVASVALSFLISRGFQWLLGVQPSYIGKFVRIDRLWDDPLLVIKMFAKQYWSIYGGKRTVYGFRYVTFPALLALGMFALAARAPERRAKSVLFIVLYMIGITAIPLGINLVAGGSMPLRALIAVPYVFWFFAAGAVLSHIPAVRRIAIVLVAIVAIQCLYTFSVFQAQKRLVLDHDKLLASEIYARIVKEIPDFDRLKPYVVEISGAHEYRSIYREIPTSTLSASFFEIDRNNRDRIPYFMKIMGYANLVPADPATQQAVRPIIQNMPVWPAAGSVRVVDGIVLIHLGRDRSAPAGTP